MLVILSSKIAKFNSRCGRAVVFTICKRRITFLGRNPSAVTLALRLENHYWKLTNQKRLADLFYFDFFVFFWRSIIKVDRLPIFFHDAEFDNHLVDFYLTICD